VRTEETWDEISDQSTFKDGAILSRVLINTEGELKSVLVNTEGEVTYLEE